MPKRTGRLVAAPIGLAAVLFAAQGTSYGTDQLNRSIYMPVQITPCDHIRQAVLYRGNDALRPLPGKQVFQFSYYPSLHRLVPEVEHLQVKALREDGTQLEVGVVVTPTAVFMGDKSVQLDYRKQLERLRTRVDARYSLVKLKLACNKCCKPPTEPTVSTPDRP